MMKLQRRFKDQGIGGITARWYDNNTRKNRLAEIKAYAKEVALTSLRSQFKNQ
jgi:hypothetical protein